MTELVVPAVGKVANSEAALGTVLLDAAGEPVEAVSDFFATMLACGGNFSSLRSYGLALLRWWRFLAAVDVPWQRASRVEARDFVLWMRLAGPSGRAGGYAPATINHALAVIKMFYADRIRAGDGPLVNPVPDADHRHGRRSQAHHNPMQPFAPGTRAPLRQKMPERIPRHLPDRLFDGTLARASGIDSSLTGWVATFLMAPHNTRIVRRSNGLLGWSYGKQFRYREVHRIPGKLAPVTAAAIAAGLWTMQKLGPLAHRGIGPRIIDRLVPEPGTGPSAEARDRGFFTMDTFTRTSTGATYKTTFAMDGDPGYKATAVILGEVGLCLALDRAQLSELRGVLTPATVMAEPLATRLRAAGAIIEVTRQKTSR